MCENDQINGLCTNLQINEVKFVLIFLLRTFLTKTVVEYLPWTQERRLHGNLSDRISVHQCLGHF